MRFVLAKATTTALPLVNRPLFSRKSSSLSPCWRSPHIASRECTSRDAPQIFGHFLIIMALLSPGSSPVSENHPNAPGSAGKEALKLFSPFSRLPRELRQEVWFMALESSEPRVYTFVLEREQQGYRAPITEASLRPLPLRPGLFWERDWRGFIAVTATRRSVSTACRESRDCMLYLLPDSIQFKKPLSGTIHFSGMRDIITISGLSPRIMRDVIDWIRDAGPFRPFRNIRHLAFESETLAEYSTWREAGPFCCCESPECGFCMLEPLPGFLACFPSWRPCTSLC